MSDKQIHEFDTLESLDDDDCLFLVSSEQETYNTKMQTVKDKIASGAKEYTDSAVSAAVQNIEIADGSVTTNKLASWAVTSEKIKPSAVSSGQIAPKAVTATKIAENAVTVDKIAEGAITPDKLESTFKATQYTLAAGTAQLYNSYADGYLSNGKYMFAASVVALRISPDESIAVDAGATLVIDHYNGRGIVSNNTAGEIYFLEKYDNGYKAYPFAKKKDIEPEVTRILNQTEEIVKNIQFTTGERDWAQDTTYRQLYFPLIVKKDITLEKLSFSLKLWSASDKNLHIEIMNETRDNVISSVVIPSSIWTSNTSNCEVDAVFNTELAAGKYYIHLYCINADGSVYASMGYPKAAAQFDNEYITIQRAAICNTGTNPANENTFSFVFAADFKIIENITQQGIPDRISALEEEMAEIKQMLVSSINQMNLMDVAEETEEK